MRIRKNIGFVLLFVVFPAVFQSQAQSAEKHFLWKVKSGKATVYMLGSIHLMKENIYPLDDAIENAYKSSDNLVVEVNMENINPFSMLKKAMYQDSNTLEMNVSKEVFARISASFDKNKVKKELYNKYRPWFAVINLLGLELMGNGYSAEFGIDKYFMDNAKKEKKNILELESFDQQIDMLENGVQKYEKSFIDFSMMDYEQSSEQVDKMVELWKKGDGPGFEKVAFEEAESKPEFDGIMKIMIDNRNFKMADKIKEYLKTDQTYFVVVGSGHIIGKNGLIKLLEKENFTVEQM